MRARGAPPAATRSAPSPPPAPFDYLLRVGGVVGSADSLSPRDQESLFGQLMHALREEQDVSVQGAIVDLLAALRRRSDVTPSTVSAIDDALESRTPQQTSGGPASGIFISYRRDDEKYFAGRLYERLLRHFSRQQIFMDVDSIPLGLDFTKVVEDRLAQSGVMLVVIGKNWLNCVGPEGHRRLDDPDDFVRLEIETALEAGAVRVIPVLVDGASVQRSSDLRESLRPLSRRHGINMSHEDFGSDATRLVHALEGALSG